VVGVVDRASDAGSIVAELSKAGIRAVDVSVLAKPDVLEATAAAARGRGPLAALGKSASWLTQPRSFEKPDVGKLVGTGPLAEVLAGSPSSSPTGALVMQGIPQREALVLAEQLKAGKILVLVGVADRTMGERIHALLGRHGAQTIAYFSGRPYGTAFHGTGPGLR
jgi:hypothetical protein